MFGMTVGMGGWGEVRIQDDRNCCAVCSVSLIRGISSGHPHQKNGFTLHLLLSVICPLTKILLGNI